MSHGHDEHGHEEHGDGHPEHGHEAAEHSGAVHSVTESTRNGLLGVLHPRKNWKSVTTGALIGAAALPFGPLSVPIGMAAAPAISYLGRKTWNNVSYVMGW